VDCTVTKKQRLQCNLNGNMRWRMDGIPCLEIVNGTGTPYGQDVNDVRLRVTTV